MRCRAMVLSGFFVLSGLAPVWAQEAAPQKAPASKSVSLGAVRPGNLVLPQLSVQYAGDATVGTIIQKDLDLADVASAPADSAAVSAAAAKDRAIQQGIDYDAWTAAGVSYVLRGTGTQAELFDVASRQRVFGKNYQGAGDSRRLAHKVADDVMQAITGAPGIFSSKIVLLTGQAKGKREVCTMDADGANLAQLTSENAIVATPAWGRRGAEIFFTSYKDNNPDLYGITLDRRRFVVSRRPGLNTSPAWSDAASRLVVTLSKDGNSELYTMGPDGQGLARLTKNSSTDTAAVWSPDGSQVAYTSDDAGQPQIYVMSASGGAPRRISGSGYFDSPSWSPDGKKLAYVAREKGEFNVYMADLASGTPTKLTGSAGDNMDPSWAPNSKHLIFCGTRGGGRNIFIINTETKIAKPLTKGGTYDSPQWGPLLP